MLFEAATAVQAAVRAARQGTVLECHLNAAGADSEAPLGLRAFVEQHKAQYPGNAELQAQLDDWMEQYEAEEQRKTLAARAALADDGWTVVTKKAGRKRQQGARRLMPLQTSG